MASKKPRTVLYRRKRELKTNYNKRLKLLTSRKPRVVVRFTNQKIVSQIVEFLPQGDFVKVAVSSEMLKKHGWKASGKNVPAAYLTGLLLGKKAVAAGLVGGTASLLSGSLYESVFEKSGGGSVSPEGVGKTAPLESEVAGVPPVAGKTAERFAQYFHHKIP